MGRSAKRGAVLLKGEGVDFIATPEGERNCAEDSFLGICSLLRPTAVGVALFAVKISLCRRFISASLDNPRRRKVFNILISMRTLFLSLYFIHVGGWM